MASRQIRIAVIGAGLGGTSAALALLKLGADVHLFEQAAAFGEVGAGVTISPNAARVLHGLGLGRDLVCRGVQPNAWHQRRWDDGRTLLCTPLAGPMEAAFGFPHYQIHRADLLDALLQRLPHRWLHPGHRLERLLDLGDEVELDFANGQRQRFDAVVGADGIHSVVRRLTCGPDSPSFSGCVAYRGLVEADRLAHLQLALTMQLWMGPGQHFVHYFVRRRELVNFVAVVERSHWTRESWTARGDKAQALAAFAGWHPQVREILSAVDGVNEWALFDRPPLPLWTFGRVTLLGDACHPMLPFMAQGAAQAIEDGATLAACVAATADVRAALLQYESLRLQRTSRVQAASTTNKTRFHLPDGPAQQERDRQMSTGTTDWAPRAVAWLYEHDAWKAGAAEFAAPMQHRVFSAPVDAGRP